MLIDIHTHIFPSHMLQDRGKLLHQDPGFHALYQLPRAQMVQAEAVIRMLDEAGVDRAVVFGFPWQDLDVCRRGNDYVLESASKFPDRLVPFITLPWENSEKITRACEQGLVSGAKGVGELALYGQPLDRERIFQLDGVADSLEKVRAPLILHVNEPVGHAYPGKTVADFGALHDFILAHPELPIILAHWGGGFFLYELMPEIRKSCLNVFYDTAASPFLYDPRIYQIALEIVGADRILFGSDFPLIHPFRYLQQIEDSIPSLPDRSKIRGENARRLLGL